MLIEIGLQGKRFPATFPFALVPPYVEMDGVDMESNSVRVTSKFLAAACSVTGHGFRQPKMNSVNVQFELERLADDDFATSFMRAEVLRATPLASLFIAEYPVLIVDLIL